MASVKPAMIRIAGISGSLRKGSYNRGLIRSGTLSLCFSQTISDNFFSMRWACCLILFYSLFHSEAVEICNSIKGIEFVDADITALPLLNTDLEVDGKFPAPVEEFRQKIASADAFLFASPEYNYSIAGLCIPNSDHLLCLSDISLRLFVKQLVCVSNQAYCALP